MGCFSATQRRAQRTAHVDPLTRQARAPELDATVFRSEERLDSLVELFGQGKLAASGRGIVPCLVVGGRREARVRREDLAVESRACGGPRRAVAKVSCTLSGHQS